MISAHRPPRRNPTGGPSHACEDRLLAARDDRAQIDNLDRSQALGRQGSGRGHGLMRRVAPSHDRPATARADMARYRPKRSATSTGSRIQVAVLISPPAPCARAKMRQAPARRVGGEPLGVRHGPRLALDVASQHDAAVHRTAPNAGAVPAHRLGLGPGPHAAGQDAVGEPHFDDRRAAGRANALAMPRIDSSAKAGFALRDSPNQSGRPVVWPNVTATRSSPMQALDPSRLGRIIERLAALPRWPRNPSLLVGKAPNLVSLTRRDRLVTWNCNR